MDLYLIRHADALPLAEGGNEDDAERPLSDAGKAQARALALALQRQGLRPEAVLTSPLLRARQTAEEMLKHWPSPAPSLEVSDHLAMGAPRKRLSRQIKDLQQQSVALVGHQPDLCEFAAWLIGSKKAQIDLAKAGFALINCSERPSKGGGTLVCLVNPAWYGAAERISDGAKLAR
jgi:phosphohistidine phosphatase